MITAIDTNVLIDLFVDDQFGPAARDAVSRSLDTGRLVICDAVWAEIVAYFGDPKAADDSLRELGAEFSALNMLSASAAGEAWRAYRRAGGPRSRVVADFIIGAHGTHQADRLLTRDRGVFRRYFPKLTVVEPGGAW